MIWLASFPRSGNTFARNVLVEVYGLESTEVNLKSLALTSTHDEYPVVKTHLLPEQVRPLDNNTPVICLVRDGRDALVSMAYHRSNIVEPGSDFTENLELAIQAQKGSYFGGWHINALKWILHADIVIRFEDLTRDPISQFERLRPFYPQLPQPLKENLPTFESQKFGSPKYGPPKGKNLFFRKGRVGDWKENMTDIFQTAFWNKCGKTMEILGYSKNGSLSPLPDLDQMKVLARTELRRSTSIMEKISKVFSTIQSQKSTIKKNVLNAKLIYFSCINNHDPLIDFLKSNFKASQIGIVKADGPQHLKFDSYSQKDQTNLDQIEILISTVPLSVLKSYFHFPTDPLCYTWVIPPDEMIVRKYLARLSENMSSQDEISAKINSLNNNDVFLSFSRKYENRNSMNRVISKHNDSLKYADVGWHFPVLEKILSTTFGANKTFEIQLKIDNITLPDELSSEILRYNKRDLDLYEYCQHLNLKL
jgi:hypothetical protein